MDAQWIAAMAEGSSRFVSLFALWRMFDHAIGIRKSMNQSNPTPHYMPLVEAI